MHFNGSFEMSKLSLVNLSVVFVVLITQGELRLIEA